MLLEPGATRGHARRRTSGRSAGRTVSPPLRLPAARGRGKARDGMDPAASSGCAGQGRRIGLLSGTPEEPLAQGRGPRVAERQATHLERYAEGEGPQFFKRGQPAAYVA